MNSECLTRFFCHCFAWNVKIYENIIISIFNAQHERKHEKRDKMKRKNNERTNKNAMEKRQQNVLNPQKMFIMLRVIFNRFYAFCVCPFRGVCINLLSILFGHFRKKKCSNQTWNMNMRSRISHNFFFMCMWMPTCSVEWTWWRVFICR